MVDSGYRLMWHGWYFTISDILRWWAFVVEKRLQIPVGVGLAGTNGTQMLEDWLTWSLGKFWDGHNSLCVWNFSKYRSFKKLAQMWKCPNGTWLSLNQHLRRIVTYLSACQSFRHLLLGKVPVTNDQDTNPLCPCAAREAISSGSCRRTRPFVSSPQDTSSSQAADPLLAQPVLCFKYSVAKRMKRQILIAIWEDLKPMQIFLTTHFHEVFKDMD